MLCGLCLEFLRRCDERNQRDVNEHCVLAPQLLAHLADGFHKGQRFNVADRAANFNYRDINVLRNFLHRRLDLVRYVRNHLDCLSEVVAAPLFRDDLLVNAAGCPVVFARKFGVSETFVMTQVEVSFSTIVGNENFAVLEGRHGARIHVQIWIEFHDVDSDPAALEQAPDRSRSQSLAQ